LIITQQPAAVTPGANTDKLKTEPKAIKLPYSDAAYTRLPAEGAASATNTPNGSAGGVLILPGPAVNIPAVGVPAATAVNDDVDWAWPIQPQPKGKIIANFTDANKGIDIGGTKNAPVNASAAGKVVYSGAGLRGYGRLVIIKHNNTWLSAYAHNEKILVMEGEAVKKGQKIAEMGNSDADQVKLHFEIRKQGKPVDPVKLLPN
jgi:lipoprotein NlpD